ARSIGCPVGTIRVRLSRARERLRDRLTRRGVAPARGALAGWLISDVGAALPPTAAIPTAPVLGGAAWVEATVRAASGLSMGRTAMAGIVSASVIYFYEKVVMGMLIDWCKVAAIWTIGAGLVITGAISVAASGRGGQQQETKSTKPPQGAQAALGA